MKAINDFKLLKSNSYVCWTRYVFILFSDKYSILLFKNFDWSAFILIVSSPYFRTTLN